MDKAVVFSFLKIFEDFLKYAPYKLEIKIDDRYKKFKSYRYSSILDYFLKSERDFYDYICINSSDGSVSITPITINYSNLFFRVTHFKSNGQHITTNFNGDYSYFLKYVDFTKLIFNLAKEYMND